MVHAVSSSPLTGLQLTETSDARRCAGLQDATVRGAHGSSEEELLSPLDVQVPNAL